MTGIEVMLEGDEPIEGVLRRFKRKIERSGLRSEMKRHEFYEKPSERKRRKAEAAQRAQRRRMRKIERQMNRG